MEAEEQALAAARLLTGSWLRGARGGWSLGEVLSAVATGACAPPIPIVAGQRVEADFGWVGGIAASFA